MNSRTNNFALVVAALVVLTACGDDVVADGADVVYLNPWNHDRVDVQPVQDRSPAVAPAHQQRFEQDLAEFEQLTDEFVVRADDVLERSDVDQVLGSFEQAFLFSGRYLDLVELYQKHYRTHGVDSIAAPALAWSYVKLGNEPGAEAMIDELTEARPDDVETWVVVGKYHGRRADTSVQSAHRARQAYERVLELDPDFESFKMMDRRRLENELDGLERIIEQRADADPGVAGADQPMHHADGEAAGADDDAVAEATAEAEDRARTAGGEVERRAVDRIEAAAMNVEEYVEDALPGELTVEEADELRREDLEEAPDDEADEPEAADQADEPSAAHLVARGRRALQRGGEQNLREAEDYFEQALEADPDRVEAGIGLLRVAERGGAPREVLVDQFDSVADYDELTARQAHELGLFALRSLNDRARATSLLERVEQLDPSFARRVGVDALLEDH